MMKPCSTLAIALLATISVSSAAAQRTQFYLSYGTFVYDADSDTGNPLLTAGLSVRTGARTRAVLQLDFSDIGTQTASVMLPLPGHERYYRAFAVLETSLVGSRDQQGQSTPVDFAIRTGAGVVHSEGRGEMFPDPYFSFGSKRNTTGTPPTSVRAEEFPRWGPALIGGLTTAVRLTNSVALRGTADVSYERIFDGHPRNWSFSAGLMFR